MGGWAVTRHCTVHHGIISPRSVHFQPSSTCSTSSTLSSPSTFHSAATFSSPSTTSSSSSPAPHSHNSHLGAYSRNCNCNQQALVVVGPVAWTPPPRERIEGSTRPSRSRCDTLSLPLTKRINGSAHCLRPGGILSSITQTGA